jgi:catechol 2,3-dioxygenase-like lactoylglutathione lyase family enzyme
MMTMKTRQLVPMAFVADVERSITFYQHLGFEIGNTFAPEGATKPSWAWLQSGDAQLMLAVASDPVIAEQQAVLFYVYTDAVAAARMSLVEAGLNPGEIKTPFYAPRGEFRLVDPDGYVVMVTHT